MSEPPRPEDEPQPSSTSDAEEGQPGEETPAAEGEGPEPPLDETAPFDPFADDLQPVSGDETRFIPPHAQPSPAWAGRAGVPVPPPPGGVRESYPQGEPEQSRTWWTPILLGLLALGLLGVVILVAWWMNRDTPPEPAVTPSATALPSAIPSLVPTTPAASPTPSPSPQLVQVPANLVGMTQQKAVAELNKLGLGYTFEFKDSTEPAEEVIATDPAGGAMVPAGSTVKLVISKGGIVVTPSPSKSASPSPGP